MFPYLEYFPNLTDIKIEGEKGLTDEQVREVINRYPNLISLSIKDQPQVHSIDISSLKKLFKFEATSNSSLVNLQGLENLANVSFLTFYDNPIFNKITKQELIELVYKRADNFYESNIDVLYMPDFIEYLEKRNLDFEKKDMYFDQVKECITWSEHLKSGVEMGNHSDITFRTNELYQAYKKANEVVNKYIKDSDTPEQKYAILYQWMCENVKYDYDALKTYNRYHVKDGMVQGRKSGTNGTVNALLYGSTVCQGYSKSMQMLLRLVGISSFDVGCIVGTEQDRTPVIVYDGKKHSDMSNHSILKVNLGQGKIYYSDLTGDAGRYQRGSDRKYFLLNQKDMLKDHKLIVEDNVITFNSSVSLEQQNELLKFAEERIKRVDKQIEEYKNNQNQESANLPNYSEQYQEAEQNLENAREQYREISSQIENAMANNSLSKDELDKLISKKDGIGQEINYYTHYKDVLLRRLKRQQEFERRETINQIYQITREIISPEKILVGEKPGIPIMVSKNVNELEEERLRILEKLKNARLKGDVDMETLTAYQSFVDSEFDIMKKQAPVIEEKDTEKIESDSNNLFYNETENVNAKTEADTNNAPEITEWTEEDWEADYDSTYHPKNLNQDDSEKADEVSDSDEIDITRLNFEESEEELEEIARILEEIGYNEEIEKMMSGEKVEEQQVEPKGRIM